MTERDRPELDDATLQAELRRRAGRATLPQDWTRSQLLPAVHRAVDLTPQRVQSSRLAPLGGLAGVIAILVLIGVALPRLVPGPAGSPQGSGTGLAASPSITPEPGGVRLLTAQEFATGVRDGSLVGQTVLVDGRIEDQFRRGLVCFIPDPCFMGTLADSDPPLDISARATPTLDTPDARKVGQPDIGWDWWHSPQAPIDGLLVLSVDRSDLVVFLGRARLGEQRPAMFDSGMFWSASAAAAVDSEALDLDEVILVDAWLTQASGQYLCPRPPSGGVVDGLPSLWCGNAAWLADQPVSADDSEFDDSAALQVQNYGYDSVLGHTIQAPMPPLHATYAVARRLFTGCGPDEPTCWHWSIVGRITTDPPNVADVEPSPMERVSPRPATPDVARTPKVAPPPADAIVECAEPKAEIGAIVIDTAALVGSCVTVEATGEGVADGPVVRNPDGVLTELQIEWPGTPCDAAIAFTLVPGATGISIEMAPRPDGKTLGAEYEGTLICILPYVIHAIRLELNGQVDARNVWISRTAVPTTSIHTVSCDGSDIDVKDSTGIVVSCRGAAVDEDPAGGNPLITNPDADTKRLRVVWQAQDPAACGPHPPATALEFRRTTFPSGFVVAGSDDYVPGTGCFTVVRSFGLDLVLSESVSSSDVVFATSGSGANSTAVTEAGIFDLTIAGDKLEYRAGEPIEIEAFLKYQGPQPSVELSGVTSLVNGFGIKQLDGPLAMGPGWDEPCVRHQLRTGGPLRVPYIKSASWSDDDPNADFYREWASDPVLTLPAGTWLVTAYTEFVIGPDCAGPLVSLEASLLIVVR